MNSKNELEMRNIATNFDRQFYELAGMHFSIRYTYAKMPESTDKSLEIYKQLTNEEDFILVHDNSSISSQLPLALDQVSKYKNLKVVKIQMGVTNNVFDFELIQNARQKQHNSKSQKIESLFELNNNYIQEKIKHFYGYIMEKILK
jgi:hypothetical protein